MIVCVSNVPMLIINDQLTVNMEHLVSVSIMKDGPEAWWVRVDMDNGQYSKIGSYDTREEAITQKKNLDKWLQDYAKKSTSMEA